MNAPLEVAVCVPLSLDPSPAIEAAATAGRRINVRYRPDLMPAQRFVADHRGAEDFRRTAAGEREWNLHISRPEVALGWPGDRPAGLRQLVGAASDLRWVQGTAAGAGEQLAAADLGDRSMRDLWMTSAAGLHAVPLAEFAVLGLLAFSKDLDRLLEASTERRWLPRWPMRLLAGSNVVVLGLGGIGTEVARLLQAFGSDVVGVKRLVKSGESLPYVRQVVGLADLDLVLPEADALVVTLPGTSSTRRLVDARRLALLPDHAVVVNVGRGSVVDSAALVAALDGGRLRGAVLDVVEDEPLAPESGLWDRPDVIISPHTAALRVDEDDRIVALFADNLGRYLAGLPLRNLVDPAAGY